MEINHIHVNLFCDKVSQKLDIVWTVEEMVVEKLSLGEEYNFGSLLIIIYTMYMRTVKL